MYRTDTHTHSIPPTCTHAHSNTSVLITVALCPVGGFVGRELSTSLFLSFLLSLPLFVSPSLSLSVMHTHTHTLTHTHTQRLGPHVVKGLSSVSSSRLSAGAEPSGHCCLMSRWLLCVCPVRTEKKKKKNDLAAFCRSHVISAGKLAGAAASLKGFSAAEREIPISHGGYPPLNRC